MIDPSDPAPEGPAALAEVRRLTDARLAAYPPSPLFAFADRELRVLEAGLDPQGKLSPALYQAQRLGLLCAREFETTDVAYCDAVYALLDAVRP